MNVLHFFGGKSKLILKKSTTALIPFVLIFQNEKTPKGKKTKSPRLSKVDRTKEESEAITKVSWIIIRLS